MSGCRYGVIFVQTRTIALFGGRMMRGIVRQEMF